MGRAKVLVLIGLGLEFWAEDLVNAASNPDMVVVTSSQKVESVGRNPHIWLDPLNAISQVELIRDALVRVDPEGAELWEDNAAGFMDELRMLDQEVAIEIRGWSQRSFVAFHPAWAYFAKRYGLEQAAVVEKTPGHEPSPAELAAVIETARRIGVRAVFAEPQLPLNIIDTVAEESGAQVLLLDPLGGTQAPDDYIDLIRYNVSTMAKAMK
jgi:ABC-type Zn uptake system ZnuABC Zn-binding protein ZnuA